MGQRRRLGEAVITISTIITEVQGTAPTMVKANIRTSTSKVAMRDPTTTAWTSTRSNRSLTKKWTLC